MMEAEDSTGLNEIVDFVCAWMPQYENSKHMVKTEIKRHWAYGTLDFGVDDNGIYYAMRYNITPDGRICDVLDLCIRSDRGGTKAIKYIIQKNWRKYKTLEYFRFYREGKYPLREARIYPLKQVFKVR